jgi:hypothetical protein
LLDPSVALAFAYTVEDELAVLERAAALLLLVGDGVLREQARLEPVDEEVQARLGSRAVHHRLALVVDDLAPGGVDGLAEVAGEALVLLELAGVAAEAGVAALHLLAGRLHLVPGLRGRGDAGRVEQVLAVVQQAAVGQVRRRVELVEVLGGRGRSLEVLG